MEPFCKNEAGDGFKGIGEEVSWIRRQAPSF